jgi:hypothetical protein
MFILQKTDVCVLCGMFGTRRPHKRLLFRMLYAVRPSAVAEEDILHSHRRENLKSYVALTDWTL